MGNKSKSGQNNNLDILEIIQKRYGFLVDYIRKSLKVDIRELFTEKIKSE